LDFFSSPLSSLPAIAKLDWRRREESGETQSRPMGGEKCHQNIQEILLILSNKK
jgi:ribosomal protein L34E